MTANLHIKMDEKMKIDLLEKTKKEGRVMSKVLINLIEMYLSDKIKF